MKCFVCRIADIKTQANYQLMDDNFVGLIFSCFNEEPQDKVCLFVNTAM